MTNLFLYILIGLTSLVLLLQILLLLQKTTTDHSQLAPLFDSIKDDHERAQRAIRDEIARNRQETADASRQAREELSASVSSTLSRTNQTLITTIGELGNVQKSQLELFSNRLDKTLSEMSQQQRQQLSHVTEQLEKLTASNEVKLEAVRTIIETKLKHLQEENGKSLEEMRKTVDEKLQGTLEKRLGESFKLVSERLEQVHKGLGEMQSLATGVGDLKRVMTNVKSRGTWGEVQLEALLADMLQPEQYAKNISPKNNGEVVEFAVRLPGRSDNPNEEVWLPIDSKFPIEDYLKLVDAQDKADLIEIDTYGKQLQMRIESCARDISTKYINPPHSTDFAILFLPTEGLYAEVIRRADLAQKIQKNYRVMLAGPTTLAALLNSLQMGFQTLAIQKRSSEVWQVLRAVKTEFEKYGDILEKVKDKLADASKTLDTTGVRSRAIERKLRSFEANLPANEAQKLLNLDENSNTLL